MKKIHLIGNAHLDPVWLWRWQEGFTEVKATFRSALDRMNEFPDYKFTSACSIYYMWIEQSDKAMFDEIVARVKEGRWSIVGGWMIQPDCNIPSGESFARHSLISQRYFKEKFGVTAKTGYNVDSFGHNGSIPKILKNSGMENYVYMRPMQHEKAIDRSLFNWRSLDGSEVKTYRIPLRYNIINEYFDMFQKIADMDEGYDMMAFYGIGNHGGGPTIELLDRMKKELDEKYVYSTPDEYFDAVRDVETITITDDLQFHAKGCYSAMSEIKANNRKCENNLFEAESYSVLSNKLVDTAYPSDELNKAWQNVLFNQFHDILGGCSIIEAYTDARYMHLESMSITEKIKNFALNQITWNINTIGENDKVQYTYSEHFTKGHYSNALGTPIVVFNCLPYAVNELVVVKKRPTRITNDAGNVIPIQWVRDTKTNGGDKYAIAFNASVSALGYKVYRMYFDESLSAEYDNPFITSENSVENEFIKLELNDKTGEIGRIFDKKNNKELLCGDSTTVFVDETKADTWAHDIREFKDVVGVFSEGEVKLIENGPVRATLRSKMKLFDTEIIRDYSITANSAKISVKTKIDFHEKHKMLKFRLPVNANNPKALCEIPYGYIERETDGSEQVCGKWTALFDDNCGIVMANDSKYSFDADGNSLALTILRGAIIADHFGQRDEFCEYMEQGIHKFEYTISPYVSISDCEKEALSLNNKPTAIVETFHKGSLPTEFSGISIDKANIIVTAIKKHEDSNAVIIRLYESENKDTTVNIKLFDYEFTASFGHSEVKTFKLDEKGACEVDFMEWDK